MLCCLVALATAGGYNNNTHNPGLHIVTVINDAYSLASVKYRRQVDSVICYAARYGYGFDELDPADFPACAKYKDFFFAKHCAVLHYLRASVRRGGAVLVLDGDVAAANTDISIEPFIDKRADIIFYERLWNPELAAGNYLVRNTRFAQKVLSEWSQYEFRKPSGFSSADNGALHALLAAAIGRADSADACISGYSRLDGTVNNLGPYFDWVRVCRAGITVGRHTATVAGLSGIITILEKGKGFVADGAFMDWKTDQRAGYPPLYHGVKDGSALGKRNGCWHMGAARNS